jgi:hypothetical protein
VLLFSRGRFDPGLLIGILLVILIHEIGHAVLVKARGLQTIEIRIHGLGGECRWAGMPTALDRSIIAWGGVLFQGLLLIATLVALQLAPPLSGPFLPGLVEAFIYTNAFMALLNLLPIPMLDGYEAWRIFGRVDWKKLRRKLTPRRAPPRPKEPPPTDDADEIVRRALERARLEGRARRKDQLQ